MNGADGTQAKVESIPVLRTVGLSVAFAGVRVVADVDFEMHAGRIHALTGENGAGKSSLAKAIAGVYEPSGGHIELVGSVQTFRHPREALQAGIALIHQEPVVFPDLDVAENIFVGQYPKRMVFADRTRCLELAKELLARLGSDLDPRSRVDRLSVAQRQLIELASALAHGAQVWIFDETTASLSSHEVDELFRIVRQLKDDGAAIAFVSHRMDEVFGLCDEITVLRDGRKVFSSEIAKTSREESIRSMVGREVVPTTRLEKSLGSTVLEFEDVMGAGFGPISITVREGEVVGLAGLAGAGRTELLTSAIGLRTRTGAIRCGGKVVRPGRIRHARRIGMALVPEDRIEESLFMPLSVEFNATASDWPSWSKCGVMQSVRTAEFVQSIAHNFNLKYQSIDQPISQLSGGNQQKVVLGRWLSVKPKALLLDEPTRGVDVGAKQTIHQAIHEHASSGAAVLMASSELTELIAHCDRVVVLRNGRIAGELSGDQLTEERILALAAGEAENG